MTIKAIQISETGLTWAALPAPLDLDRTNEVVGHVVPWPRHHPHRGPLPHSMGERVATYCIVGRIAENADFVLFAVESGADGRRVGIAEAALEAIGCHVQEVSPHPDRAAGLMREHVAEVIAASPQPPI